MESCVLNDGNMILSLWKFLLLIQITKLMKRN